MESTIKKNIMNTNNQENKHEQNEKHSGGWHIFLFIGIALVALILLKLLIDYLMK